MPNDAERREAAQLREAWDALVEGRPLPAGNLDPSLEATIERLAALYQPPPPDPAFIETLGQDVLRPAPSDGALPPPHLPIVHTHTLNGHGHGAPVPRLSPLTPRARPIWLPNALAVLATAALVALVLLGGLAALRRGHQAEERPVPIPVVDVDSVTSPLAATIETRFAATLPAGQVPETGVVQVFVWRLAIDPGSSTPATPEGSCCQGPQFTHVLDGELTVHVDGSMQVFRGTDQILSGAAPSGSEVVLLPGDTVVHDFSIPSEYINRGTTPVQLVNAGLYAGTALDFWSPAVHFLDGSQEFHQAPYSPGPVRVSLLRATLSPQGEFPAPPPGSLALEVGKDSDAGVGKNTDGSLFNITATDQTIYVVIVEPGRPNLTP